MFPISIRAIYLKLNKLNIDANLEVHSLDGLRGQRMFRYLSCSRRNSSAVLGISSQKHAYFFVFVISQSWMVKINCNFGCSHIGGHLSFSQGSYSSVVVFGLIPFSRIVGRIGKVDVGCSRARNPKLITITIPERFGIVSNGRRGSLSYNKKPEKLLLSKVTNPGDPWLHGRQRLWRRENTESSLAL